MSWRHPERYHRDAVRATCLFAVIAVLSKLAEPYLADDAARSSRAARTLVDQAFHWYTQVAHDQNAQVKQQHASYASAYLHAARHIASDATLERESGVDVHVLQRDIDEMQAASLREIARVCPALKTARPKGAKRSAWL